MKRLTDICNITTGKLDSNAFEIDGKFPFFTCAPLPLRINSFAFDDDVILLAGNNAAGNFHCQRYCGKFNAYQRTYIITEKEGYDLDYIFYNLKMQLETLKSKANGSQTKFLTMKMLESIMIKDLSLDLQKNKIKALKELDEQIERNNAMVQKLPTFKTTTYCISYKEGELRYAC